jgi:hypothetical protein
MYETNQKRVSVAFGRCFVRPVEKTYYFFSQFNSFMKRSQRIAKLRVYPHRKAIKISSDYQVDWEKCVPRLKKYTIQSVDLLSIAGDAPKDFVFDREYRPGHRSRRHPYDKYIAKVGSKFYPLESVIEQLITRIGQCFGVCIADSKLRIIDGQVRFLSKYFLKGGEQLAHGAEIYEYSLGKENYAELSANKQEAEFFSFQMTCEAIKTLFPEEDERIIGGYVEMLAFDAIIGHNDRHPYNWGVIVPLRKDRKLRFAPIFDTARALFWNIPETKIVNMSANDVQFETYVKKCEPPIGWDGEKDIAFFELIALIWKNCPNHRRTIDRLIDETILAEIGKIIDEEFSEMISKQRSDLIKRCLHRRQGLLREAIRMVSKV